MADDPYAGIGTAVAPATASADPYSGLGTVEQAAELHTWKARTSKGKTISFQAPADADPDTIRRLVVANGGDRNIVYAKPQALAEQPANEAGHGGKLDAVALGVLKPIDTVAGWLDKIPGLHEASDAIGRATGLGTASEVNAQHDAERASNVHTGYQTLGKLAGVAPLSLIPGANSTIPGLLASGAAGGALLSDASTAGGVAADAGIGAGAGLVGGKVIAPTLGALARVAGRGVKSAGATLASLAGRTNVAADPAAVAASIAPEASAGTAGGVATTPASGGAKVTNILLKTLAAQPGGVEGSLDRVAAARARGVPLELMDSGDEARGLASALGRSPGDARTAIRGAVLPRQDAQIDRITGAVRRDLGDTANVRTQAETLMQQAKASAAPLYDEAYAAAPITSPRLQQLLDTPAGKSALARAHTIAGNEMRNPADLGFVLDKDGNVALDPVATLGEDAGGMTLTQEAARAPAYTPQTLDYVKRGLDDVVEANRDPVTGRLKLDEGTSAINGVRAAFVQEVDKLNPAYAAARKAYAGPAAMTSALRKGAAIGTKDAETLAAETRDLSPAELDQYRLGVRSALVKQLEARTDGSNKVQALIGSPKKRAALAQLFGGEDQFGRFMATLGDEGQAAATYGRVNTGSMTAANLADDGHFGGLAGVAANAGERALRGTGIVHNAISTLADLYRYGAGEAGARVRSDLARSISNMNPAEFEEFRQASKALEQARLGDLARTNAIRRVTAPASAAYAPRSSQ